MKFNEKKFLKVLYKDYKKRNLNFTHNLKDYTFSNLFDGILCENFKFLKHTQKKESLSYQWTDEAKRLGLIEYESGSKILFYFTQQGLERAIEVSKPIITFYKKHWKWFWSILVTVVGISISAYLALLKIFQC